MHNRGTAAYDVQHPLGRTQAQARLLSALYASVAPWTWLLPGMSHALREPCVCVVLMARGHYRLVSSAFKLFGVQSAGQKMIENMSELQEAVKVASLASLAHDTVQQVLTTVQELAKAAKHLQAGDLHLALTIINSLQADNELRAPSLCRRSPCCRDHNAAPWCNARCG